MEKKKQVGWVATAANASGWPKDDVSEVAIIGRSNAGKSTILNALIGQKSAARVSSKPGKTILLHFYASEGFRFVDMPGYGFAKRSGEEMEAWGPMIEGYLRDRTTLKGVILIMDIKRQWSKDEIDLLDWLDSCHRPVILVLNKADKFNRKEMDACRRWWKENGDPRLAGIHFVSARDKLGIDELQRTVFEKLVRT